MYISESELVLNPDGSIYHLNLHPEELADKVILVGDPDRVPMISRYFERVDVVKQKREFVTHTGEFNGTRLSVVSTGIGVGSIDITINELDALANIDFTTREVKPVARSLTLLRMGTCGGLHESLQLGDLVYSDYAFAFDGLLDFYRYNYTADEQALLAKVQQHFSALPVLSGAYAAKAGLALASNELHHGVTLTCSGFYGPQCRSLRAPLMEYDFFKFVQDFDFNDMPVLNFEMETANILALGRLLGHQCASVSVVAANRVTKQFSSDLASAVENMIELLLYML